MKSQNKIAVITGGAQGIGAAIVTRFAQEGAAVVIADVNEEKSKLLVTEIHGSGAEAIYVLCDVSNSGQVDELFKKTLERFGRLDILVNNAALVHHPDSNKNFLELSAEAWLRASNVEIADRLEGKLLLIHGELDAAISVPTRLSGSRSATVTTSSRSTAPSIPATSSP